MYLKSIALFAIGAAAHAGWKLPAGQANGVYSVEKRADGSFAHNLVRGLEEGMRSVSKARSLKVAARQSNIYCPGYALDPTDTDTSFAALQSDCDNNGIVPGYTTLYSISNDVVTYFCNWGDDTSCSSGQISDALQNDVTSMCGSYNAGYELWPSYGIGYESVSTDPTFCGTGAT